MDLKHKDDEVLVWFNRRIDPVEATLPPGEWVVGIDSDPDTAVTFSDGKVVVGARSVLALVRPQAPKQ
jgi:glycogen operon protein